MTEPGGFDALMHEMCVTYGYCGCIRDGHPMHVNRIIPPYGPVTADQFVEWVFLADDENPNDEVLSERQREMKREMRAIFVKEMGGEVVDAKRLRWSTVIELDEPSD